MGLDNYAVYGKNHPKYNPDENANNDIPNELFPKNCLCGGMFSGGGNSFRGKVYNEYVEFFTGVSLYDDIIDEETVDQILDTLLSIDEKKFKNYDENHNDWQITYQEALDLAEWFRVVSNERGCVVSWY